MYRRLASLAFAISIAALLHACSTLPAPDVSMNSGARPELGMRLRVVPVDSLPASIAEDRANLLKVVSVKEQYSAAQAGIQEGDILLELNEVPVSGMADSVAIVQHHAWGEAVLVTVLRDQSVYRIPVLLSKSGHGDNRAVKQAKTEVAAVEKLNATSMNNPVNESPAAEEGKSLLYTPPVLEVAAMSSTQQQLVAVADHPQSRGTRSLTGNVHTSELSVPAAISQRVVLEQYTNVRKGPGQSYDIVTSLDRYQLVTVLEDGGRWLRIEVKDNPEITGYVHASLLGAQPVLQ
jgi:membrane-associated protease RseP (regulator of RpoE activity)